MATKKNATVNMNTSPEPSIEDELDQVFPADEIDEINDEASSNNTNPYSKTAGLSLDELDERDNNAERDEIERAKIDPPKGNWNKTTTWQYEKRVNTQDKKTGDIDPSGRTILNFYGKPEPREENDITYEPTLFLRISPDIRYKVDKPKEHDNSFKLYLFAKELFLSIYGRAPKISEIVKMLQNDEYIIRTFNGDTGPIITGLQDPDQERVRSNRRNKRSTSNA